MEQEQIAASETAEEPSPSAIRGDRAWLEPVCIVLLALALNLAGNGRTGLWDRDEPRYAVARPRDARARRLDLPHVQRRAAVS